MTKLRIKKTETLSSYHPTNKLSYKMDTISTIDLLHGPNSDTTQIRSTSRTVSDITTFWNSQAFWHFIFNINGVNYGPYKYVWGLSSVGYISIAAGIFNTNGGQFNATIVQPNNIDADANDLTALFASMVVGRDTLTIIGLIGTPSTTSDYEDLEILNVNPKITISITDSRNPEKTKSTKSQLLQLPIEDNAEILGFVSDYAVNAEQVYDAYLETDLVQIKGKLQILGVDNKRFGVIKAQVPFKQFNWIDQTKTNKGKQAYQFLPLNTH